jgi:hypothetical protein
MYCPECGIEERDAKQFCRGCGTDMRRVRVAVDSPDSITASAVSARDEIGRAFAAKIKESRSAKDLAVVAQQVLPEIEKFLDSPEEKRMRRLRTGMIVACIGMGTAIGLTIVSTVMQKDDVIFLAALGLITFFIGLAFILNGMFLTVPRNGISDRSEDATGHRELDDLSGLTNALNAAQPSSLFTSVTEHTTTHLKEKLPVSRD